MKLLLLLGVIVLASLFSSVGVARAIDNDINVAVCANDGNGSTVTITQPINDSVVNLPVTTLRGAVTNATQIEIEIDGEYVSTVSIGNQQSTYETDVTLTEGTHTIKLIANDVCQHANGTATVVVTYVPKTETSNGGLTPTDLQGGVTIGPGGESDNSTPFQIEQLPIIGPLYRGIIDLSIFLGLDSGLKTGNAILGAVSIGITILGLVLLVAPNLIMPIVTRLGAGFIGAGKTKILRNKHYLDRILRAIGGLLLLIIFFY